MIFNGNNKGKPEGRGQEAVPQAQRQAAREVKIVEMAGRPPLNLMLRELLVHSRNYAI